MIVVNRLSKILCVLLPVLICYLTISVNAQETDSASPAQIVTADEDKAIGDQLPEINTGAGDSTIDNEATSKIEQLLHQWKEYENKPKALLLFLFVILPFVVYLWQLLFGVPDWLAATQEVKGEIEETVDCVEGQNDVETQEISNDVETQGISNDVETQQGISDDVAIELAVQVWRLEKRVGQLDLDDSPKLLRRMTDSVDKFKQLLQNINVIVDDPINRKYVDGWLEVKAVAWEEVPLEKCPDNISGDPFVLETIRPIVRREGRPISIGRIVVAECEGKKII